MEMFIRHHRKNHRIVLLAIFLLTILVAFSFGQDKSAKECKDKNKKKGKERAAKIAIPSKRKSKPKSKPKPVTFEIKSTTPGPTFNVVPDGDSMSLPKLPNMLGLLRGGDVSEKSISAHPKVFVYLCVSRGTVKVNGWNRDEVRAFVDGGSKVDFKVRERKGDEEIPTYIEVFGVNKTRTIVRPPRPPRVRTIGFGSARAVHAPTSTCLSGGTIELDVPKNASIKIKGSTQETNIDTVRWAEVNYTGGSIFLSHVKNGVKAQTYRGNVTVRDSGGKMDIGTASGDVIAYRTESNEIGDYLKAKTQGGSVTLQSVGQRDVKVNSVSGSINYVGKLANYGRYSFGTGYGTINLAVPARTSCTVDAKYGGYLKSELKILDVTKNQFNGIKSLSGKIGGGSCNLIFKTFNGSILIKKFEKKPEIANRLRPSKDFITNFKFLP